MLRSLVAFSTPPFIYDIENIKNDNDIHDSVEGTTYNHGRPEGISEDQHPMNQFLGMLRAGPPIRTHIHGIIPRGSSLPTSPDPAP